MGGQDSVVGFDHRGGHTGSGVDGEFQLGLLAILSRETLQQQSTEARTGTTTERVEDKEALQRAAVVWWKLGMVRYTIHEKPTGNTTNTVNDIVDQFLSNSVVSTSICNPSVFDLIFRIVYC